MLDQASSLRKLAESQEFPASDVNSKPLNQNKTKIITVTSGKGGVGKSNFVVNLSITLQKMGKKVLIFDADIGMGNDDILMGFIPKYNIYDIIINKKEIEEILVEGPYGVKLLPGGSGINKIKEISDEQRKYFLSKLESLTYYDYIILDTGAGISRTVLGFISCCDELIVLTTPEPTSLTDAYSLLKAVSHFKIKNSTKIVVNRVFDDNEAQTTYRKFSGAINKFLNIDATFLGSIAEDKKLVISVRNQKPLVIGFPTSDAAKDINIIAKKMVGDENVESNLGVHGLFKKIFSIFS